METTLDEQDTIETLKHQLKAYKALNNDLSKKVQELKIQVSGLSKELTDCQTQVLEKDEACKKYKRCLNLINAQCFQFSSAYFNIVQEINEEDPEITLNFPKQGGAAETTQTPRDMPQLKPIKPPRRYSLPNDAEILGAIAEESRTMQTSTPFVNNPGRAFQTCNAFMKTFGSMSSVSSNAHFNTIY